MISQRVDGKEDATNHVNIRVFSSPTGTPEDPVTGSACSFATKYWMDKEGKHSGESIFVHQVSSRGGSLEVTVERKNDCNIVKLRGECRFAARGEIYV